MEYFFTRGRETQLQVGKNKILQLGTFKGGFKLDIL